MKITKVKIPDVLLIEPKLYGDERGFFFESYNKSLFKQYGIPLEFVQDNHVLSARGVLRGLHYQRGSKAQAKLVRVIRGSVFDVAVDIRKSSPTFGKHIAVTLRAADHQILYVPVGFAHGYCALEDGTEVLYKVSSLYSPPDEAGIVWNDPALAIQWPKLDADYKVSGKDSALPAFKELEPV